MRDKDYGNLARRAFRRPVTADDVNRLIPFYDFGREAQAGQGAASTKEGGGSFDSGIEQVVAAILASPDFLYRSIRGVPAHGNAAAGTEVALTDLELASRL